MVKIDLVSIKPIKESELENGKTAEDIASPKEDQEEEDENAEKMFKVVIEKPDPSSVKLSRKNLVHVTICNNNAEAEEQDANAKLLEFYLRE